MTNRRKNIKLFLDKTLGNNKRKRLGTFLTKNVGTRIGQVNSYCIQPTVQIVVVISRNVWASKPLIKCSYLTNGLCFLHNMNKVVGSPLPTVQDSINLVMKYSKIQNIFGLNELIFINGYLIPSVELASIISTGIFISIFFIQILVYIKANKDIRSSSYEKLKNIPKYQWLEFILICNRFSMCGFVGTITIKALIVFVYKDSLYKAAQIEHYEDARIFHSFGLKKTVSLEKAITLTRRKSKALRRVMPEFQQYNQIQTSLKYPKFQLMHDHTGKSCTDILMRECRIQLRRSVKYKTTQDLINYSVLETSDDVLLYIVYCVMHYKEQLDKCYKLLL